MNARPTKWAGVFFDQGDFMNQRMNAPFNAMNENCSAIW
jgi:hypothetical protein